MHVAVWHTYIYTLNDTVYIYKECKTRWLNIGHTDIVILPIKDTNSLKGKKCMNL